MNEVARFCEIVRQRSVEHAEAFARLNDLPGMMCSILRQELDSMIRAIYLRSIDDTGELKRLIQQTLNGEKWTIKTHRGKYKIVTDREMVKLANFDFPWTESVYKFGCAFIHLSNCHEYNLNDPFLLLEKEEKDDILNHMRQYHNGPESDHPSFQDIAEYFPSVFEKITSNLSCEVRELESKWCSA